MTLTADGRLVVAGEDLNPTTSSSAFYAARLNADGLLDTPSAPAASRWSP